MLKALSSAILLLLSYGSANAVCKTPMDSKQLSIDGVARFVNKNHIRSVEQLVSCLPGEIMNNYMLIHESRSAQKASPLKPKVFAVSTMENPKQPSRPRLQFGATFSHHPGLFRDSFEMVDVNRARKIGERLDFARIDFSQSPPALKKTECKMCHGTVGQLVMDAYPDWTGFYGEREFECSKKELAWFQDFRPTAKQGLYSYLPKLDEFFSTLENDPDRCMVPANQRVHDYILFESMDDIARRLSRLPNYQDYKFAYMAAALQCPNLSNFLPSKVQALHRQTYFLTPNLQKGDFKAAYQDFRSVIRLMGGDLPYAEYSKLIAEPSKVFWIDSFIRADQSAGRDLSYPIAGLRYLVEARGYSMLDWFSDLNAGHYRSASGFQTGLEIASSLEDLDPELAALNLKPELNNNGSFLDDYRKTIVPAACESLRAKSIAALTTAKVQFMNAKEAPFPSAFGKCVACHDRGLNQIPFADPIALKTKLYKNLLARKIAFRTSDEAREPGLLPPGEPVWTKDEKRQVEVYLKSLGFTDL